MSLSQLDDQFDHLSVVENEDDANDSDKDRLETELDEQSEKTAKAIIRKMKVEKKKNYDRGEQIMVNSARFFSAKNILPHLRSLDTEKIKSYSISMNLGFSVASLSVIGDLNVGAIMRTAQLMGCEKYIVMGKKKFDPRSAVGAMTYMNVIRAPCVKVDTEEKRVLTKEDRAICPDKFYNYMTENNLVPVFVEQTKNAVFDDQLNWKLVSSRLKSDQTFCFVFGSEGDGVAEDVLAKGLTIPGSFVVCIRQLGVMKSFNVSVAATIIMLSYKNYKIQDRLKGYNLF
ncbi:RNA methyltransferase, TrmH family [Yasminevirus sp. GU-2018]|uniref:RNA methyltransferase, TrmH family n=1 Tax=Yasminevirus sp. GU-2018 TaxID=2420051 RepID=A0A5K0U8L2_9VIRU|nr:RNA methyltransferase, TrmH family [Yasminevirus sp. GU-2018]